MWRWATASRTPRPFSGCSCPGSANWWGRTRVTDTWIAHPRRGRRASNPTHSLRNVHSTIHCGEAATPMVAVPGFQQGAMRANPAPVYDACTMTPWLTLEQALGAPGLRVAPVRGGLPSPWSEFVRACFHVKRIPYSLVDARDADRGLTSIKTLTGQESLPVVFWN